MKKCTGCNELKALDCFSLHKGFKDGRNSKCKLCKSTLQRQGHREGRYPHTPYSYGRQLKGKYGITIEEYESMLLRCESKCEICGEEKSLNVDHCHSTGSVRGLLCTKCNTGLGKFGDDIEMLRRAIRYLDGESTGS